MWSTITADASHCPKTNLAGYGYWIASDRGSFGGGGPLMKGEMVETSVIAEMMAIVNAVYYAIKAGRVQTHDAILIQSDCKPAMDALDFKHVPKSEQAQKVVAHLNQLMLQYALTVKFRHVKGHSAKQEARYKANNHCDKRAKDELNKLRGIL